MANVVVTRRLPNAAITRLSELHDVRVHAGVLPPNRQQLLDMVSDADALLSLLTDRIDAGVMSAAPNLRVIANYAVGVDNIDLAAASNRSILVGNTPDVLTDSTADLTLALLLAVARRLPEALQYVKDGNWHTWEPMGHLGLELKGADMVIVGAGRIGCAVADRARAFGVNADLVGRLPRADLLGAFARADIISLHCPLTDDTRTMIDAEALSVMKPNAILINTARGPLVDHEALNDALQGSRLAGAGLDVTDPEPLPPDHALFRHPRVVVAPHIGSATELTRLKMANMAVDNVLAGLRGDPLPFGCQ